MATNGDDGRTPEKENLLKEMEGAIDTFVDQVMIANPGDEQLVEAAFRNVAQRRFGMRLPSEEQREEPLDDGSDDGVE